VYVQKSFHLSDGSYGYLRVHADLAGWGVPAGSELVRSLMRELGLEPCQPQPWRLGLTASDGLEHDIPDLVSGTSPPGSLARRRSVTSRIFRRGKAGCIWPRSWIAAPGRSSAGQWMIITRRPSSKPLL
jgi:HTH-like domain